MGQWDWGPKAGKCINIVLSVILNSTVAYFLNKLVKRILGSVTGKENTYLYSKKIFFPLIIVSERFLGFLFVGVEWFFCIFMSVS